MKKQPLKIKKKGFMIGFLKILLILLLLIAIIPYLIPLSNYEGQQSPFVNSHHFKAGDSTLHYRVYEPEIGIEKGKILLIHGLGGSTFSYEKNAPALAEAGYLVITVDLPGFGYSSRNVNENHAQTERAAKIWQLLDDIDQNSTYRGRQSDTWHIGGHSMGGGTVAAMAQARPDEVASMIFIDGALFENSRSSAIVTFPVISRWVQVLLEHVFIKPARIESFLTSAYGKTPTEEQVLGYYEPLSVKGTAKSALALLKTAKNLPVEALEKLDLPALAIWGEKDAWVPFDDTAKIKALMPQLEIHAIKGAGHCPMETHPEEVNQLLLKWLESCDGK